MSFPQIQREREISVSRERFNDEFQRFRTEEYEAVGRWKLLLLLPGLQQTGCGGERQQRKISARKKVQYFFRKDSRMSDRIGVGY